MNATWFWPMVVAVLLGGPALKWWTPKIGRAYAALFHRSRKSRSPETVVITKAIGNTEQQPTPPATPPDEPGQSTV
jgi:hypothetical protein